MIPEYSNWTVPVATKSTAATPCQFLYAPKSNRKWNFSYQPAKVSKPKQALIVELKHKGQISVRLAPSSSVKIRSQKKHTAPVLFWRTGTAAEMTMVLQLITQETSSLVQSAIAPRLVDRLPIRIIRLIADCIVLR